VRVEHGRCKWAGVVQVGGIHKACDRWAGRQVGGWVLTPPLLMVWRCCCLYLPVQQHCMGTGACTPTIFLAPSARPVRVPHSKKTCVCRCGALHCTYQAAQTGWLAGSSHGRMAQRLRPSTHSCLTLGWAGAGGGGVVDISWDHAHLSPVACIGVATYLLGPSLMILMMMMMTLILAGGGGGGAASLRLAWPGA